MASEMLPFTVSGNDFQHSLPGRPFFTANQNLLFRGVKQLKVVQTKPDEVQPLALDTVISLYVRENPNFFVVGRVRPGPVKRRISGSATSSPRKRQRLSTPDIQEPNQTDANTAEFFRQTSEPTAERFFEPAQNIILVVHTSLPINPKLSFIAVVDGEAIQSELPSAWDSNVLWCHWIPAYTTVESKVAAAVKTATESRSDSSLQINHSPYRDENDVRRELGAYQEANLVRAPIVAEVFGYYHSQRSAYNDALRNFEPTSVEDLPMPMAVFQGLTEASTLQRSIILGWQGHAYRSEESQAGPLTIGA